MDYAHIKVAYQAGLPCQIKSPGRDWEDLGTGINFTFADHDTEYRISLEYAGFKLVGTTESLPSTGFTMAVFNSDQVPVGTRVFIKVG